MQILISIILNIIIKEPKKLQKCKNYQRRKANAYGHGAPQCAGLLYELGCRYFAVANLAEALEIRNTVPEADILILGATNHTMPEYCRKMILPKQFTRQNMQRRSQLLRPEMDAESKRT